MVAKDRKTNLGTTVTYMRTSSIALDNRKKASRDHTNTQDKVNTFSIRITSEFRNVGVSGSLEQRSCFNKMTQRVKENKVDYVIVSDLKRLPK